MLRDGRQEEGRQHPALPLRRSRVGLLLNQLQADANGLVVQPLARTQAPEALSLYGHPVQFDDRIRIVAGLKGPIDAMDLRPAEGPAESVADHRAHCDLNVCRIDGIPGVPFWFRLRLGFCLLACFLLLLGFCLCFLFRLGLQHFVARLRASDEPLVEAGGAWIPREDFRPILRPVRLRLFP
eukprot:scaffold8055_cov239-Pinguiococcus_pyrenoidosus.AAC.1